MKLRRVPRTSVIVRVVMIIGLLALGLMPAQASGADEGTKKVEIGNKAESWYAVLPLLDTPLVNEITGALPSLPSLDLCSLLGGCADPLGALGDADLPEISELILPKNTLSIETLLGAPLAQAFVVPDFDALPEGASVTGAELRLPVNLSGQAQNRAIKTAKIQACLVTSEVTDGERGRLTGSPKFTCEVRANAEFDTESSIFTIDLAPFVKAWAESTPNYGVVLRPGPDLRASDAWHVTLNGSKAAGDRATRTVVTYADAAAPTTPPESGEEGETPTPAPGPGVQLPDLAPVATPPLGEPQAQPPAAAPVITPPVALATAPYSYITQAWYTFAGVIYLPLAMLLAVSLVGRSLTRPLSAAP